MRLIRRLSENALFIYIFVKHDKLSSEASDDSDSGYLSAVISRVYFAIIGYPPG